MKRIIAVVLCLIFALSLAGCGGKTPASSGDDTASETAPVMSDFYGLIDVDADLPVSGISFADDNPLMQYRLNKRGTDSGTYYSFVGDAGDEVYMTLPLNDKPGLVYELHRVNPNGGDKPFIAQNAWGCLEKDGVLYYIKWEGDEGDPYYLISNRDGKETVLTEINDCLYGQDVIYFVKDGNLYCIKYGESTAALLINGFWENYFGFAEYNGRLYVESADGICVFDGQIKNAEKIVEKTNCSITAIRNGCIFYDVYFPETNTSEMFCYNIDAKTEQKLPLVLSDGVKINFTDDYLLAARGDCLYKINPGFNKVEKVFKADGEIDWLVCTNNRIFIWVDRTSENLTKIMQLDLDGMILFSYKLAY
ncbi:MAG: hypothetical protein IJL87_06520 [Clostridia bacterium]|nr:hypothetical protein [Clostridia bacterium]